MHGYPRPQFTRPEWTSLNGIWEFSLDCEAKWNSHDEPDWNMQIAVPFSPESPASGIGDTGLYGSCWYRREFYAPKLTSGERFLLHFGAVYYLSSVWIN